MKQKNYFNIRYIQKTIQAWAPNEREEDDAIRLYTGATLKAPEIPKLRKVLTNDMKDISKEISSKCNIPYYVNMQARKRQNKLDLKNGKIDRFEFRRRDRDLAETFTNFECERRDQIERQMDEVRRAARRIAKGRMLYVHAMFGSATYFISNKIETETFPFRETLQPLDPRGIDTKRVSIQTMKKRPSSSPRRKNKNTTTESTTPPPPGL